MKLFLTLVLFFICLGNYAQTNDTIYILFKNDKLHSKKVYAYHKGETTPYFMYEYQKLTENERGINLLFFYTVHDFDKVVLPMIKPKSFMKKIKKKGKVYTCKQFKKMGYEQVRTILEKYGRPNNKIYIIDAFENIKDSLYLREVKHRRYYEM